jgi:hypothetical protein
MADKNMTATTKLKDIRNISFHNASRINDETRSAKGTAEVRFGKDWFPASFCVKLEEARYLWTGEKGIYEPHAPSNCPDITVLFRFDDRIEILRQMGTEINILALQKKVHRALCGQVMETGRLGRFRKALPDMPLRWEKTLNELWYSGDCWPRLLYTKTVNGVEVSATIDSAIRTGGIPCIAVTKGAGPRSSRTFLDLKKAVAYFRKKVILWEKDLKVKTTASGAYLKSVQVVKDTLGDLVDVTYDDHGYNPITKSIIDAQFTPGRKLRKGFRIAIDCYSVRNLDKKPCFQLSLNAFDLTLAQLASILRNAQDTVTKKNTI